MRVIKAPPPDLATLLVLLGPQTLVLVEGDADRMVLNEWYPEGQHNVLYHVPGGGAPGVENTLQEILTQTPVKRAFGIIDRDFRPEVDVEARLSDPNNHLFVWRRYAIENYLLEPSAIQEELRPYYDYGSTFVVPDRNAIQSDLLQTCRRLRTLMAANWVFSEIGGIEHFTEGHDSADRQRLVEQSAVKMQCDVSQAEQRVVAKEALLDPLLAALETAQTCVNGKHLLHHVYLHYISNVRSGLRKDYFFNLLVRAVKEKVGLHPDVKTIVEQRILA